MRDIFGAVSPFARQVSVRRGEDTRRGRAFIQPLSAVSPEREKSLTPAGRREVRRYLIIAEPELLDGGSFGAGAVVECLGRRFELLRCEKMGSGSHWEGLLRPLGGCGDA